jgi:hypothetical protein
VLIGSGGTAENRGIAVGRYLSDGTLDPTFGSGGVAVMRITAGGLQGAVQPDGKILATSSIPVAIDHDEIAVTRLTPTGRSTRPSAMPGCSARPSRPRWPSRSTIPGRSLSPTARCSPSAASLQQQRDLSPGDDGTPDVSFGDGGSRVFRLPSDVAPQPADLKIVGFAATSEPATGTSVSCASRVGVLGPRRWRRHPDTATRTNPTDADAASSN